MFNGIIVRLCPWTILVSVVAFAVCGVAQEQAEKKKQRPIRAMLVTGGCCHDYDKQKIIITRGISARTNLKIDWTVVQQGGKSTDAKIKLYENPDWAKGYDIVIHNECFANVGEPEWIERVLKPHREGVNAIVIHCAMHTFRKFKENGYRDFLGVTSRSHGPHYSFRVENLEPEDPIMKGFGKEWVTPRGELYYVDNIAASATPLARALSTKGRKKQEVCIWKNRYGKSRVFGTTIGHHNETMASPKYLEMLTRGFLWAVDRLDEKYIIRPPTKKVPVNLALNRPATCSEHQQGHLPRAATDGSLETRYCAPDNDAGDWFQVDLQEPQEVTEVQVHWEQDGRLYRFRLEGSADGKNWNVLHDGSANKSREQVQSYRFKPQTLRYLKMTCTETESGAWFSFWEFRVHGRQFMEVETNPAFQLNQPTSNHEKLLSELKVPEGFRAKIFASPPLVNYPVCLTSTTAGDVFVGVDKNGSLDRKTGRGKIVKCIDSDRDGEADQVVTFCEVDSPRGLVWDRDRLYVLHPPNLSVFYDRDHDGKADSRETLIKGIGFGLDFRGADHTTNGIRMGIDGWIYIAVGDYGFTQAVGRDGTRLQLKGGGVVRVRPDGSDMEIFARGTRNICDVAIDPFMNIFARDNTNDGGGWDIRLEHIVQSANLGYPTLFRNFNDEILPPLADYGGGSGTGALYVSNEALPKPYQKSLLTCDWGRSRIYWHPLQDAGATFKADQKEFLSIPRPTDLDIDANGRIYVASWRGGQFKYQGENIGYVAVLIPESNRGEADVKFDKLSDSQLVELLKSDRGAIRRQVAREIQSGRKSARIREFLRALVLGSGSVESRAAAVFAGGPELAFQVLKEQVDDLPPQITAALIRTAADRKIANPETRKLIAGQLDHPDARIQAEAVIALGRIGAVDETDRLIRFGAGLRIDRARDAGVKTPVNSSEKTLRHLVVKSLVGTGNVDSLVAAVQRSTAESQLALDALKEIHSERVVDGLIDLLQESKSHNRDVWSALIRIYFTESPYKGDWWGTRPDTRGPYYKPATWGPSTRIGEFIKARLPTLAPELADHVVKQLKLNRVKLPGVADLANKTNKPMPPEMAVKIPEFDRNNPELIGNMTYDQVLISVSKHSGDARKGELIFRRQSCAACHTIQPDQKAVGPQLVDIGLRYQKSELIESIVKPTAKIAQGFATQIVATEEGLTFSGFVIRESGDEIELRTAQGKSILIPKDSIEARKESPKSVMPEGLVHNLTAKELASLIAYLQSLRTGKKTGPDGSAK